MCAVLWQGNMVPPWLHFQGAFFFLCWREREVVDPSCYESQVPGGCTVRLLHRGPSWAAGLGPPLPSVGKILRSPLLLPASSYLRAYPSSGCWCQLFLHQSSFLPFPKSRGAGHPEEHKNICWWKSQWILPFKRPYFPLWLQKDDFTSLPYLAHSCFLTDWGGWVFYHSINSQ